VHLHVPSEVFTQRGKRISEPLAPTLRHNREDGTRYEALQREIKKMDPAKESAETRENSERTMYATNPRCPALLTLTCVHYRRAPWPSLGGSVFTFSKQSCL